MPHRIQILNYYTIVISFFYHQNFFRYSFQTENYISSSPNLLDCSTFESLYYSTSLNLPKVSDDDTK